jgi:WD40 repeat protein
VDQGLAFEPKARTATRAETAYDARVVAFFSADERYVAAGGSDNVARVWETATGRLVAFRHDGQVINVALSADGKYLATLSQDGFLRVWDVDSQTLVALLPRLTPPYDKIDVAFNSNGKYLLTSHDHAGGAVEMWLWRPEHLLVLTCDLLPVGDPTPSVWRSYLGKELARYLLAKSHKHCPAAR